jgi:hypothetical protein
LIERHAILVVNDVHLSTPCKCVPGNKAHDAPIRWLGKLGDDVVAVLDPHVDAVVGIEPAADRDVLTRLYDSVHECS